MVKREKSFNFVLKASPMVARQLKTTPFLYETNSSTCVYDGVCRRGLGAAHSPD